MATPEEIAEEVFENTPEVGEEEIEGREEEVGEEVGEEVEEEETVEEVQGIQKKSAIDAINHVLEKMNEGLVNINQLFSTKKSKNETMNGSISNMLNYQMEKESDEAYLKYLEYLKAYYERDGRKSVFQKSFENGNIILSHKGKRIRITPSVIVDLYHYKELLEKEIHTLLFKIVDLVEHYSMTQPAQKEEFQKYKNAYITFKKQHDDIQRMEEEYIQKIKSSEMEIANTEIELEHMKEVRIQTYAKIKSPITQRLKESLMMLFKESNLQKPSMDTISKISKEENIPIEDIEFWLEWIEKSYLYVSRQEEYSIMVKKYNYQVHQYEHMLKNYILQKPVIQYE
jgi:hypothetical protein